MSDNEAALASSGSIAPRPGQAGTVYASLRSALLAGAFSAGERLKTAHLASDYGVSLSVVREALSRLASEGLTVASARRGFSAAGIGVEEIEQQADAMREIEAICLRRSIAAATPAWDDSVGQSFARLAATPVHEGRGDRAISTAFTIAYAGFRDALVSACDNRVLLGVRSRLRDLGLRHENICGQLGAQTRDAADSHRPLLEAALARDGELAVRLLSERIMENARLFVAAYRRAEGQPVSDPATRP